MRAFLLASCFASVSFGNSLQIHDDYKTAYELVAQPNSQKPLVIFAQKLGKPEIPSDDVTRAELSKYVVAALPLDYEVGGKKLFETSGFVALGGKPGVIRFDKKKGVLNRTAHFSGEYISRELFLKNVAGFDRLQVIKAAMPAFSVEFMNLMVRDPKTYWYNKATRPPVYQDGLGRYQGILMADQNYGTGGYFGPNGFEFPFHKTAGTDKSRNVHIANFISLPLKDESSDERWPIVYYRKYKNQNDLDLIYPKGTVVSEVLYLQTTDKVPYVLEVRTRTRELDYWSPNVYRPFPEAEDYVKAIEENFPNWKDIPNLVAQVEHAQNNKTVKPLTLFSRGVVHAEGGLDAFPPLDNQYAAKLFRNVVYKPCEGHFFKSNRDGKNSTVAFAASGGNDGFHVFPPQYEAGALAIDQASCARCHDQSGRTAGGNYQQGEIWGLDGIFSYHPFRTAVIARSPQRYPAHPVDKRFVDMGLVAAYDTKTHPQSVYKIRVRDYQRTAKKY